MPFEQPPTSSQRSVPPSPATTVEVGASAFSAPASAPVSDLGTVKIENIGTSRSHLTTGRPLLLVPVVLGVVVIAILCVVLAKRWLGVGPDLAGLGVGLCLAMIIFLVQALRGSKRPVPADIRAWVEQGADKLPALFERATVAVGLRPPVETLQFLVQELGARGVVNRVFRLCKPEHFEDIDPIRVPFEPLQLDETQDAVDELIEKRDRAADDADAKRRALSGGAYRGLRRNVLLRGGWAIVVIFGFNVLVNAFRSFVDRRLHPELVVWSLALASALLFPLRGSGSTHQQWLAVPGGLVRRKASWFGRNWEVQVFDRRQCTLCVFQAWREQWRFVVAGEDAWGVGVATRREIEFLLRAWLSPLTPPPVERLSDLR